MNTFKKLFYWFVTIFCFNSSGIFAQTFPFSSGTVPLCDTVYFTANVFGVGILQPPGAGFGSTLTGIEINITSNHPQTLKVTLTSPAGTNLLLAQFLGAGGSNYVQTTFIYTGAPSITTGSPPFTGNFLAQGGSLSVFDGEDPNGPWVITIVDTACFNIPPGGTGGGPWTPSYFNGSASADGGIAIGGNSGPLPVTLLSLDAFQKKDHIYLEWSTASELNNHYFDIEKATEPDQFRQIGKVYGNGTTTNNSYYTFVDEDAVAGIQYYRLKQTDYDGRTAYFGPIAVDYEPKNMFEIISTYTSETGQIQIAYLNGSNGKIICKIHDLNGKQVYVDQNVNSVPGKNIYTVDTPLSSGLYLITLTGSGRSISLKHIH